MATGAELWRTELADGAYLATAAGPAAFVQALGHEDHDEGRLYRIAARSGEIEWSAPTQLRERTHMPRFGVDADYIGDGEDRLTAYDIATGEFRFGIDKRISPVGFDASKVVLSDGSQVYLAEPNSGAPTHVLLELDKEQSERVQFVERDENVGLVVVTTRRVVTFDDSLTQVSSWTHPPPRSTP